MANYKRPGVFIEETLLNRTPEPSISASTVVFVAAHNRGPTELQRVASFSEFQKMYGGFVNTAILPYSVFQYFNNGGSEAIIRRVAGAGATAATVSLNDRDATTPQETLVVDADNPGVWGNSLYVSIADRGTDLFDLTVYAGGTNGTDIVERFIELSMDPNHARYVETIVNSMTAGSAYITVTDSLSTNQGTLGYAGVRPATTNAPVALTGGADGAAVTATELTDALADLESLNRTYLLYYPGVYDTTVLNGAMTHAENTREAFVVIDTPPGIDAAGAVAFSETLTYSSFGAVYYPHIHIADPGARSPGATKLVPPGAAVCGIIAQTDASRGVWKAPAGLSARVMGAVSSERTLSSTDLDSLNSAHVNAIRHAPGSGFVVWGARTLKRTQSDKYVPVRRTLIYLTKVLYDSTQWAVFEPNDENLWTSLEATVENFLVGVWQQGGLRGASAEQAFFVRADASLNTPESIASGVVNVEVGVALQHPAEFVIIKLSQWEGGAAVAETAGA